MCCCCCCCCYAKLRYRPNQKCLHLHMHKIVQLTINGLIQLKAQSFIHSYRSQGQTFQSYFQFLSNGAVRSWNIRPSFLYTTDLQYTIKMRNPTHLVDTSKRQLVILTLCILLSSKKNLIKITKDTCAMNRIRNKGIETRQLVINWNLKMCKGAQMKQKLECPFLASIHCTSDLLISSVYSDGIVFLLVLFSI